MLLSFAFCFIFLFPSSGLSSKHQQSLQWQVQSEGMLGKSVMDAVAAKMKLWSNSSGTQSRAFTVRVGEAFHAVHPRIQYDGFHLL
jgi:hypothetical protein